MCRHRSDDIPPMSSTRLTFTDENRARVVESNYLPSIILQLQDTSLIPFAIPVLYNICIDYGELKSFGWLIHLLTSPEPAQKQASDFFLTKELIELISSPKFDDAKAFLGYICKILDLMVTQRKHFSLKSRSKLIMIQLLIRNSHLMIRLAFFSRLRQIARPRWTWRTSSQ